MVRPDPEAFRSNFQDSDLPLAEKLYLAAKNHAIKIRNRSNCCGNHGEPGC